MLAVRGYDERWYLDEDPKTIYLPVPYLWTPFAQVYEQMQRKLSVYMGAVSEYDIRNQLCEYFLEVFVNLAGLMRGHFYHLKDINPPFQILWGIYKGDNRTLLYQDRYGKDTTQFLSELQPVNQFRSFDEAELLKEQVKEKTFVYLNARRSRIQEMRLWSVSGIILPSNGVPLPEACFGAVCLQKFMDIRWICQMRQWNIPDLMAAVCTA